MLKILTGSTGVHKRKMHGRLFWAAGLAQHWKVERTSWLVQHLWNCFWVRWTSPWDKLLPSGSFPKFLPIAIGTLQNLLNNNVVSPQDWISKFTWQVKENILDFVQNGLSYFTCHINWKSGLCLPLLYTYMIKNKMMQHVIKLQACVNVGSLCS